MPNESSVIFKAMFLEWNTSIIKKSHQIICENAYLKTLPPDDFDKAFKK